MEEYLQNNKVKTTKSSIEIISAHYGAQAVVVSIDPKRVYFSSLDQAPVGKIISKKLSIENNDVLGPSGEEYCWWQVTVKGGRESRDLCAVTLAIGCQELGAGEIMLNSIDMDGQCKGYDIPLISAGQYRHSITYNHLFYLIALV